MLHIEKIQIEGLDGQWTDAEIESLDLALREIEETMEAELTWPGSIGLLKTDSALAV